MWSLEDEYSFRDQLIETVIDSANQNDGTLSRVELGHFNFQGIQVRLIDVQGGIWNPDSSWPFVDQLRATLSINTTKAKKYEDQEISSGLWRYDYQSGGSAGKNTKMRKAMELRLPLLWFVQQDSGRYIPYRVFIINDFPGEGFCFIAPDLSLASASQSESVIERQYAERLIRQRLHQPAFRARVLSAYQVKCAICQLGHGRLLDAAHITPDKDEDSSTSVTNGLSLCKIHHTAYDINMLGIDGDFSIHIREDILAEKDGPMLEHGIKGMDGRKITVPHQEASRPSRERLDSRFFQFSNQ
jgi:putative restriction endonuclease